MSPRRVALLAELLRRDGGAQHHARVSTMVVGPCNLIFALLFWLMFADSSDSDVMPVRILEPAWNLGNPQG